jgi:hypothetical protein
MGPYHRYPKRVHRLKQQRYQQYMQETQIERTHSAPCGTNALTEMTEELASLQAELARDVLLLAMDSMMRILATPVPEPNDQTPAAKLVRALMLADGRGP